MKKATYSLIVILFSIISLSSLFSCKKLYHCTCSYNNEVVFVKDLGSQVFDDAKKQCNSYDTTQPGEKWTCTVY